MKWDRKQIQAGVLLTSSKAAKTFRVDSVYLVRVGFHYEHIIVQSMTDRSIHVPLSKIKTMLSDVYAPWIRKIWIRDDRYTNAWYYQMRHVGSPSLLGMKGKWKLWAQL